MFFGCSLDVLRMFAGFFQDVIRMLRWVLWASWNLMIISNESMDFNDPKELNDPQLFESTVIPPSLIVLFSLQCDLKKFIPLIDHWLQS